VRKKGGTPSSKKGRGLPPFFRGEKGKKGKTSKREERTCPNPPRVFSKLFLEREGDIQDATSLVEKRKGTHHLGKKSKRLSNSNYRGRGPGTLARLGRGGARKKKRTIALFLVRLERSPSEFRQKGEKGKTVPFCVSQHLPKAGKKEGSEANSLRSEEGKGSYRKA